MCVCVYHFGQWWREREKRRDGEAEEVVCDVVVIMHCYTSTGCVGGRSLVHRRAHLRRCRRHAWWSVFESCSPRAFLVT